MNMKAAVFKNIGNIQIEEVPMPTCPANGLLVKVIACGICGGDVRNYHNGLKGGVTNQIMGHEIAGEIVEAAGDVSGFHVGDRVALAPDVSCGQCWYCKRGLVNLCQNHKMLGTHFPGGYAQYIALPQEVVQRGFIEKIPDDMSYEHAAFAETCSAVIACQNYNNIGFGDRVVIIGDGPVGCLHIEVARARGASTIIMVGMDKLELAKQFNPDHLLNNSEPDKVVEKVIDITDGIGADVVICAVPSVTIQPYAIRMLRKRGKAIIYGGVPKDKELSQLNSNLIHYNELSIVGAFSYPSIGLYDAIQAIHSKVISADKYINAKLPLERVVDGMEMIKSGKALKVILMPWEGTN